MRQKSWDLFCQCLSEVPAATQHFFLSEWVAGWPGLLWISNQTQQKINLGSWLQPNVHTSQIQNLPSFLCLTGILEILGCISAGPKFFVQRSLVTSVTFKSHFLQSVLIKPFVLLVHFCKISLIEKWKAQWRFLNKKMPLFIIIFSFTCSITKR